MYSSPVSGVPRSEYLLQCLSQNCVKDPVRKTGSREIPVGQSCTVNVPGLMLAEHTAVGIFSQGGGNGATCHTHPHTQGPCDRIS